MPGLMVAERTAGRFGPVQLVAVESAALAVGSAAYALPPPGLVAVGAAAAVLVAGALGRSGGRWWYEAAAARLRLRRRVRGLAPVAGTRSTPLAVLAPDLTVRLVTDRRGPMGVGSDRLGWFAAVEVVPEDGMSRAENATLRLDWLARLAADVSMPASGVQLVARYAPLPSPTTVDPRTQCADSYRELLRTLAVPINRDLWIAIRLTHRAAAAAAAGRGGELAGVHRALAAGLDRLGSGLSTGGHRHRVLDARGLAQALTVGCGPDRIAGAPETTAAGRERWSDWQAAGAVNVSFAVRAWPAESPPDLLDELAGIRDALAVSIALSFRPDPEADPDGDPAVYRSRVGVQALVRIAAAPEVIENAVAHLLATAGRLGVRLVRLNGEQADGVYATAPTGATIGLTPW